MTRINIGIEPAQLSDRALLAEHREIKRLPNHLAKYGAKGLPPKQFKLGTGHVKFCLWIGKHTFQRYLLVHLECIARGFKVQDYSGAWSIYDHYPLLNNDYTPSKRDIQIITKRLKDRRAFR